MNGASLPLCVRFLIIIVATESRQPVYHPSPLNPTTNQKIPSRRRESAHVPSPVPPAPSQSKFKVAKSFLRKLTGKFSKKQPKTPRNPPAPQPPVRTYEFVNPSQLRDSPSPKPKYGYITGSPRSSFTPPSPSWLSRNVPLSPPTHNEHNSYAEFTGSLGENNSFAIHSTFLPPDLTGRPRRHPHNDRTASPRSPLLAPSSPPLPTKQSTPHPSPPSHRHYRPPTPPKGRRRRSRAPSAPEESILGDLASSHPTHHRRSHSSPPNRDTTSSSTVSSSHPFKPCPML